MWNKLACSLLPVLLASPVTAQAVVKREPPEKALRAGQSVLVDDGTCPVGQIKRVVGGSEDKRVKRQRSCVPRPDRQGAPAQRPDSQGY